ncbi:HIRAN domain-containing protein [Kribbella sp. NBC_01245]|uniref:hypothetical protein n=1 Tax=Kribbella sp. NBC_01245 TaxID=2903578 RepID=UPI002E2DD0A2|nr:hypothetical protein [Kribbella sp. NBC_01245]
MKSIPFDLWGDALWCGQEVVREAAHEQAIRGLFPDPIPARGADLDTEAELVPEPYNRFDPRAIAVRVHDQVVGYLPREDAHRYHAALTELVAQGLQPRVPCHIWVSEWAPADWEHKNSESTDFHASVAIALGQPHMLVPVNLPPPGGYQLLPSGGGVAVSGSGDHADVLAPLFRPEGECWAYATLHAVEEEGDERPKMVVEVRIDDEPVGRLSPKLSHDFLPAIHYLADMRAETAARVIVRGDRLVSEVILYAARSHDLPATWPDGLTRSPVAAPGWHYWIGKEAN